MPPNNPKGWESEWEEKFSMMFCDSSGDQYQEEWNEALTFITNLLHAQTLSTLGRAREVVRKATVTCGQWDKETSCEAVSAIDLLIEEEGKKNV